MILRNEPPLSLYTNYFSAYRKNIPDGVLFLSIARTQPKSFRFKNFDKLFPPRKKRGKLLAFLGQLA